MATPSLADGGRRRVGSEDSTSAVMMLKTALVPQSEPMCQQTCGASMKREEQTIAPMQPDGYAWRIYVKRLPYIETSRRSHLLDGKCR